MPSDFDITSIPLDQIPALLVALSARLVAEGASAGVAGTVASPEGDRLLTVDEAAERLSVSKDWLYRAEVPFAVRLGPGQLRFSAEGLARYIKNRMRNR
jgi:excisionase family DNA binding protein